MVIRSSWTVDEYGVRPLGAKRKRRLGNDSSRRIEIRRRLAEYGQTISPWEYARRHK